MRYINEDKIFNFLRDSENISGDGILKILRAAKSLKGLTLSETAALLNTKDEELIKEILSAASYVKDAVYGRRIVIFAPLYISNFCVNGCLYCAFKADNTLVQRRALKAEEIKEQVAWLLERGHKRLLLVAGEGHPEKEERVDYYLKAIEAIYSVRVRQNSIRRVNINCAPLTVDEFRKIKAAGIGTYQLFQETYHEATYRKMHPYGPKGDPDNRLDGIDRAFLAGIDDVGIGVLYGLYEWRFEVLALLSHIRHLEEKFGVGPHTISVPRLEPALGSEVALNPPQLVSDEDFKKIVAILRLAVPYTGIILSTRETPKMRDALFGLGVSQISTDSRTSPGGYSYERDGDNKDTQFNISDRRSLDEVIGMLIKKECIPSFCAACYRKERTGEDFMRLAKPGTIKGKCNINALITLKEYLDDFASPAVKEDGYELIKRISSGLGQRDARIISRLFKNADRGVRDEYV